MSSMVQRRETDSVGRTENACFLSSSLQNRCAETITFWHTLFLDRTALFWSVEIVSGENYARWIFRGGRTERIRVFPERRARHSAFLWCAKR
jgi:hypothetical protein